MLPWLRKAKQHERLRSFYTNGGFDNEAEQVREAVREGIEFENAEIYFRPRAIFGLIISYGLASTLVGFALRLSILWSALGGVIIGLFITFSFCSYPTFAKLKDLHDVKARQFFVGMWIKLAIMIGALSLAARGIRWLIFR